MERLKLFYSFICPRCNFLYELYFGYYEVRIREATNDVIVAEDEKTYTEDHTTGKTTVLRKITKISKLYDVSAVSIPANDQTTISARNLSDGWIEEAKAERLRAQKRAKLALKIKMLESEKE